MPRLPLYALLCLLLATMTPAHADEGMWTFENPPAQALAERYRFSVTPAWLEHLRLAAVNFSGASASFVSPQGLLLTNHHVGFACIEKLSKAGSDFVMNGFLARSREQELPCPDTEIKVLQSSEDVSAKVFAAVQPTASDEVANTQRKTAIAGIEQACAKTSKLRCEVVSLYHGALYHLYRYKVWHDVRLVFAPEKQIAFFGGDPDNFVFPRYDLDFAIFRAYQNGQPVKPASYLHWSREGIQEHELVFAAGHPYSTDRLDTVIQLESLRDLHYPLRIASAQRQRAVLTAFAARSPESARRAENNLFGVENRIKALQGEYKALNDGKLMRKKTEEETALRKSYRELAQAGDGDPWRQIAVATSQLDARARELWAVTYGRHTLFSLAGQIVELAHERLLPEGERLEDYREAAIASLLPRLKSNAPIYKDLEIARLAGQWQEAADLLGRDHPFVRRVLGDATPLAAATALIEASKIDRAEQRVRLIEGGVAAVEASTDPLIVLARDIYPMRRALQKFAEIEGETPIKRAAEIIGRARYRAYGDRLAPDATATLRLTFGSVSGYDADGILTPWKTNFLGLQARAAAFDERPPFDLPPRWTQGLRRLAPATPLDFVSTLDIIGGNSGSPVVNRQGEWVGLIFDQNLEGLGNRFVYSDVKARAVAVDARAIMEALVKVYGADDLARELRGE
ncbi:MAG: S46 family peptidase [Betaproteobacteria bacterium]|nr:S46 family peptidase [Betaproteobacteria bacterium]